MQPPEPNKKVDDLLKAYSRKRREQAEPGFELHPASRQMLQDEVRRTYGKTDAKARSGWGSPWWWRGLALAGGLACVLILCLHMQPPATNSAERNLSKPNSTVEVPSAGVPAPKPDNLPASVVASDSATRNIPPPAAAPAPAVAAAPPPVAVAQPGADWIRPQGSRRESAKDVASQVGLEELKGNKAMDKLTVRNAPQAATLNFETKQLAEAPVSSGVAASEKHGGQQFVQFDNRAQYRKNVLSPPLPKVLTAFEVARAGDKVRITDADGSVYEGEVLPPPASKVAMRGISGMAAAAGGKKAETTTNETYSFQVSGLNRNLKQKVVFTGNLTEGPAIAVDNAASLRVQVEKASHAASWGNAANQQSFQNNNSAQNQSVQNQASVQNNISTQNQQTFQNQPSVQNYRCAGRVRVGTSSEFEIEAVPAP